MARRLYQVRRRRSITRIVGLPGEASVDWKAWLPCGPEAAGGRVAQRYGGRLVLLAGHLATFASGIREGGISAKRYDRDRRVHSTRRQLACSITAVGTDLGHSEGNAGKDMRMPRSTESHNELTSILPGCMCWPLH